MQVDCLLFIQLIDVLVTRNPGRVYVYRMPTHTDRYLAFQSHHPIAHKIAVIKTLNYWAKNLPLIPTAVAQKG